MPENRAAVCDRESTAFGRAFCLTMLDEGGWTSDGPTYMGIDRRYWPDWRGWFVIDQWLAGSLTILERDEILPPMVRDFYLTYFWTPLQGERIALHDLDLACLLFNIAVNKDTPDAIQFLQEALNLLNINEKLYPDLLVDGKFGPKTYSRLVTFMGTRPPSLEEAREFLHETIRLLYGESIIKWMRRHPEKEKYRGLLLRPSRAAR